MRFRNSTDNNNGNQPVINFGKQLIEFCYKTNTDIAMDMYANPYSDANGSYLGGAFVKDLPDELRNKLNKEGN